MMPPVWTKDELNLLEDLWGVRSFPRIVKELGRTEEAVKRKAVELGLGQFVDSMEGYTLRQFAEVIGVHHNTVRNWIVRHGLPAPMRLCGRTRKAYCIRPEAFWKWAEQHQGLLNLSGMEEYALGPEPHWAKEKRETDRAEKGKVEKRSWTTEELNRFVQLNEQGLSARQIAIKLGRSRNSILARRRRLKI